MPTLELESAIRKESGLTHIAGIDEAGRGAIAGPVFAAAVLLPLDEPEKLQKLSDVDDSKRLSAKKREELYQQIVANALAFGIGSASAEEIDHLGIIPANHRAMEMALSQLNPAAHFLLLDGREQLRSVNLPQRSVVRGDSLSLSIAAASILAKVSRDRHMISLDGRYPGYNFGQHKGYCTAGHVTSLASQGPCEVHRHSFRPIRQSIFQVIQGPTFKYEKGP
jgi:ribonuclease HII